MTKARITSVALALALSVPALSLTNTAHAAPVWVDCQPYRVAEFDGRAHTQCSGDGTWYVVNFGNHSVEFASRFIALVTSAIAANKPLKILYDNASADANNREVLAVEMFK